MVSDLVSILPLIIAIIGLVTAILNLIVTVRRTRFGDAFGHRRQVKRRTRRAVTRRARHRRR